MLLSVVIPTCERPEALATCLDCIGKQTLSREDFEIIVTDDSASSVTRDLVLEKYPSVTWTRGPGRGPAANRNHGATLAKTEWIVFVDDDCQPSIGWLDAIASQDDVDIIEGKTICPDARDTPFQERVENLRGGVYWTCNLAIRRLVFERLRGFDEDFLQAGGEDMEFAWRIARDNLHTRFVLGALVAHPARAIGWEQIWRRTWMIRWFVLYLIKTGQSAPLRSWWLTIFVIVFKREVAGLLRATLHFFARFDPKLWRAQLFQLFWKWLTFPLVLPYVMAWEIIFRRSLPTSHLTSRTV